MEMLDLSQHYGYGTTTLRDDVGRLLQPHGCTVMLCEEGKSVVTINFRKNHIKRGCLLLLFDDTAMVIDQVSEDFRCSYITVNDAEMVNNFYNYASSIFWNFVYASVNHVFIIDAEQYLMVRTWMEQCRWIMVQEDNLYIQSMLGNQLHNLFCGIELIVRNMQSLVNAKPRDKGWIIVDKFYRLMTEHISEHREVSWYARELNISTGYLNTLCHRLMHLSTKAMIKEMTVATIKQQLDTTNRTVAEISVGMRFDNLPYLCRFFRKETGMSPIEYKERNNKGF